jgi:hypothetical protein
MLVVVVVVVMIKTLSDALGEKIYSLLAFSWWLSDH